MIVKKLIPAVSGIGPRQHLEEHGIEVVRDLPGVGSELVCYNLLSPPID